MQCITNHIYLLLGLSVKPSYYKSFSKWMLIDTASWTPSTCIKVRGRCTLKLVKHDMIYVPNVICHLIVKAETKLYCSYSYGKYRLQINWSKNPWIIDDTSEYFPSRNITSRSTRAITYRWWNIETSSNPRRCVCEYCFPEREWFRSHKLNPKVTCHICT
jgi:hypothetical protein